jgi:nucleoporin NDC1
MGIRTSNSLFDTAVTTVLGSPFSTLETILTYIISAWLFSQTYLLSLPKDAGLSWISHATGRSRLNEHALFYTINLIVVGVLQGVFHIALDQDQMLLGTVKTKREGDNDTKRASEHWSYRLGEQTPVLVLRSGMQAITVGILNYIVLYHFLRPSAWRWAMWFFRLRYSDLPKYNFPPGSGPWSVWMLVQTIWGSFLLSLLWFFGDAVFRMQLAREPLKNEQPLTAESKDPNGSLLNGLKSKKPRISVSCFPVSLFGH